MGRRVARDAAGNTFASLALINLDHLGEGTLQAILQERGGFLKRDGGRQIALLAELSGPLEGLLGDSLDVGFWETFPKNASGRPTEFHAGQTDFSPIREIKGDALGVEEGPRRDGVLNKVIEEPPDMIPNQLMGELGILRD